MSPCRDCPSAPAKGPPYPPGLDQRSVRASAAAVVVVVVSYQQQLNPPREASYFLRHAMASEDSVANCQ